MASDQSDEDPGNTQIINSVIEKYNDTIQLYPHEVYKVIFAAARCDACEEAYTALEDFSTEPDILWVHIEASVLKAKQKDKTQKKKILYSLKKKVCALRNTSGGHLLIHLKGKSENNSYLGKFDEAVEHPLKTLISDGSLFIDNFQRQWMSEFPECFGKYTEFVVLTVRKSETICTVDYNTKIPTDLQIEDPTFLNFKKLLSDNSDQIKEDPALRGYATTQLHECRSVQLKAGFDEKCDLPTLSDKIWKVLRFREYLSAMSKVNNGGSYYLGVKEGDLASSPILEGFPLSEEITHKDVETAIRRKLKEDTVILSRNGVFESASQYEHLIKFDFHHLNHGKVVLQIAVNNMQGFVFYRNGPRAYKIISTDTSRDVKKMDKEEWQQQLFQNLNAWSPVK